MKIIEALNCLGRWSPIDAGEPGIWVYIRGQGVNLCEHLYHIDEDDDDAIAEYVADVLYDWWGVGEC